MKIFIAIFIALAVVHTCSRTSERNAKQLQHQSP
jgi:hypothetical protein